MSTPSLNAAPSASSEPTDRGPAFGLTIALAVLGIFITYLPITGVSVALTTIGRTTHASTSGLEWVSDAFVIPMAAAVLSAGVVGDLFGRRRVYVIGMALTVLGTAVSGVAATIAGHSTSLHVLWIGQVVSGIGAGMLLPTTLALIGQAVPDPDERGEFIGMWATGLSLGLALGPLVTGALLEFTTWGWIFLPTGALAFLAGALALTRLPESSSAEGRTLDGLGQILATVAITASIYATIEGGERSWGDTRTVVAYAIAAVSFMAFLLAEHRSPSPLLNLKLFRSPAFSASGFSAFTALFSIVGAVFLLSLFLGYVQHISALQIGLRMLFAMGISAIAGPIIGKTILPRVHPILLLGLGLAVGTVSILLLLGLDQTTTFVNLAWRLAVFGIAIAMVLTSVSTAAMNSVPLNLAGMAAAGNTVLRQYGGALGPAVLGVVYSTRAASGASPSSALHTAIIVDAALLGASTVITLLIAAREMSRAAHGQAAGLKPEAATGP